MSTTVQAVPSPVRAVPGPGLGDRTNPSRARRARPLLLLLPALACAAAFFAFPLLRLIYLSFTDPEPGFDNYASLLTDGVTLNVVGRTVLVAAVVAVLTLLLGYPYAYAMTRVSASWRAVLMTLVLLPFWTSVLARNFAWLLLMQDGGLIQRGFAAVGVDGVVLFGTPTGVTIAMTQVLLPYMVLPLFSNMQQVDGRLLPAAASLGAPRARAFRQVYLPLTRPGMVAGLTLVFVLSLGFFVTPSLLGSSQQSLVAQLVSQRVTQLLDFAGAGALGTVLLLITLLLVGVTARFGRTPATDRDPRPGGAA